METVIVLLAYLYNSILTISLATMLFGIHGQFRKTFIIGIAAGLADYIVQLILVPKLELFQGVHLITGSLLTIVLLYKLIRLSAGIAIGTTFLAMIIAALNEMIVLAVLYIFLGMDFIDAIKDNKIIITLILTGGLVVISILTTFVHRKGFRLFNSTVREN